MTGNEQVRHIDPADAAPDIVGIEDRLPEKLLATPSTDSRLYFSRAAWCDEPNFVACEEI